MPVAVGQHRLQQPLQQGQVHVAEGAAASEREPDAADRRGLIVVSTGATDGIFFQAIGIPVYGVPGMFMEPDLNGARMRGGVVWLRSL